MQYRKCGNTGVEVSALGFGCMRLPTADGVALSANIDQAEATRIIRHAIDSGVNYIDTAYFYHDGNSEAAVGEALLGGYRERVQLATKSPVYSFESEEDFDRVLDEQLARLQTDHIDFYLLHALSLRTWKEKVLKFHLLEKMEKAKRDGKIRFIGFSFHDNYDAFVTMVDGFDRWDFCQIQLNYVGTDYQAGLRGLEYAAAKGLGVIIMEPLLGGRLAVPPEQVAKALSCEKTPVEWALDYLWNRPEVSLVLSGMGTMQQTEDNLTYAGRSSVGMLSEGELAMLAHAKTVFDTMALVPCTKCAYCMPCPFGLDIPKIYEAYNLTVSAGIRKALESYNEISVKADACKRCQKCEKLCPQAIASSELMPQIADSFTNAKIEDDD
ncbi:aldo/keto reductase [Hydrogenoanaerobacterium sp.]|uniref:aldo/keto reductase n=1 Tax=Hydrogenoanaerobacterium sp. TaxID=2953763 RepID=UPI00289A69FF|nr:aldo/keto reductase [Hydrogenoanaerobacterium sp.]